jgi:hypothetical protein
MRTTLQYLNLKGRDYLGNLDVYGLDNIKIDPREIGRAVVYWIQQADCE